MKIAFLRQQNHQNKQNKSKCQTRIFGFEVILVQSTTPRCPGMSETRHRRPQHIREGRRAKNIAKNGRFLPENVTVFKSFFPALHGRFPALRLPAMCQRIPPGHCQCLCCSLSWQCHSQHWFQAGNRDRLHAKRRGLFRLSFPRITRPPKTQTCLTSAREDLQANASALGPGSLGNEALNIDSMVETMADFLPRKRRGRH